MLGLGAILTASVTPFDAEGRVDDDACVGLWNHLLAHGSDGLVVGGTTGESATLTDEEHVALVALAVSEVGERGSIVAGAGSNDTRHAVELTERVTDAGADAILSVTPYYNRPSRRGILAHYREVVRATDKPILLYNIPQRTGLDLPNDLLAELAQMEGIAGVKQARYEHLSPIDGLELYAGNDDTLAAVLDLGGAGGILVAAHLVGDRMRRMVDEPAHRAEIAAELAPLFQALSVAPAATTVKAALRLVGLRAGDPRLPYVACDEAEIAAVRAGLQRVGVPVATA